MRPSRLFLVLCAQVVLLQASATLVDSPLGSWLLSPALAQEAPVPKPDYEAAKRHYNNAEAAAAKEDWSTAAKEYGVAYEITRDAVLFFKLGNAYQLSGDCTRAVEYYERYLKDAKPSEEYANDTQNRIHECQSNGVATTSESGQSNGDVTGAQSHVGDSPIAPSLGQDDASEDLPERGSQPSFMDEEVTWQKTAAWTSVGITVGLLSASAVLGLSAKSREEDLDNLLRYSDAQGRPANFDATVRARYEDLQDEGEELNTMSMVALGIAGVSTAAAIVFFVLDDSVDEENEGLSSLAPVVGNDTLGVQAGFRF